MAEPHNPTGPIPKELFDQIANAPFAGASKAIRQFDPMFGRAEGEVVKWRVEFTREVRETGVAYVEAASLEEAEKLAGALSDREIDGGRFDHVPDDWEIEEVRPTP
jgi:hypothetical protein